MTKIGIILVALAIFAVGSFPQKPSSVIPANEANIKALEEHSRALEDIIAKMRQSSSPNEGLSKGTKFDASKEQQKRGSNSPPRPRPGPESSNTPSSTRNSLANRPPRTNPPANIPDADQVAIPNLKSQNGPSPFSIRPNDFEIRRQAFEQLRKELEVKREEHQISMAQYAAAIENYKKGIAIYRKSQQVFASTEALK